MGFAVVAASALTGMAVLRMYFSLFCGRADAMAISGPRFGLRPREAWTFVALVITLIGFGVMPRLVVESSVAASREILQQRQMRSASSDLTPIAGPLPDESAERAQLARPQR
jgi:NADH:ubiquinone oxidoreductase subunit 4 (subunit M)